MADVTATIDLNQTLNAFYTHRQQLRDCHGSLIEPMTEAQRILKEGSLSRQQRASSSFPDNMDSLEQLAKVGKKIDTLFDVSFLQSVQTEQVDDHFSFSEPAALAEASLHPLEETEETFEAPSLSSNPCIAVVGPTCSGKSALLNRLLGLRVLESFGISSTHRLTHVTYGETVRYRLRFPNGQVTKWRYCDVDGVVRTTFSDNHSVKVEVKAPSDFLKLGIDVIDSPGRDESTLLSTMSQRVIESLLPVLIYVIDGRNLLQESDYSDLWTIKGKHPACQIFYVITKLDRDEGSRPPRPGVRQPPREQPSEETVAKRTMENVHKLLANQGFLASQQRPEECTLLHGVSLLPQRIKDSEFFRHAFKRLKRELVRYIDNQLSCKIIEITEELRMIVQPQLTCFIQRLNGAVRINAYNKKDIEIRQRIEKYVHSDLSNKLLSQKASITEEIRALVEESNAAVIERAQMLKYPTCLSQLLLSSATPLGDEVNLEKQCTDIVMDFVVQCLTTELQCYLQKMIRKEMEAMRESFENPSQAFSDGLNLVLQDIVTGNPDAFTDYRSLALMVYENLSKLYRLSIDHILKVSWYSNLVDGIRNFFNAVSNAIQDAFGGRDATLNRTTHNKRRLMSKEWKKEAAVSLLAKVEATRIADDIFSLMKAFLDVIHERHTSALSTEAVTTSLCAKLVADDKLRIFSLSQKLAQVHVGLHCISGSYQIQNVRIQELLGERGSITSLCRINQGEPVAMKELRSRRGVVEQERAMEIFHSMSLQHANMVRTIGLLPFRPINSSIAGLRLFMEFKRFNAREFLRTKQRSLTERLQVVRDMTTALLFLNQRGIVHRRVKLENVLVDDNGRAFLADLMSCTPVGLCPSADVEREEESVDIVDVGLVWFHMLEGSGRQYLERGKVTLGEWPARPGEVSEAMWRVVTRCWDVDAANRPQIVSIIQAVDEKLQDAGQ